jgi:hypothetical protein
MFFLENTSEIQLKIFQGQSFLFIFEKKKTQRIYVHIVVKFQKSIVFITIFPACSLT